MPSTKQIKISGKDFEEADQIEGLSLDKYRDARRTLKLNKKRALAVAAFGPELTINGFKDALAVGLRPDQIIGLVETKRTLSYIVNLVKQAGATLDEAVEAFEARSPESGSFSYISLRHGDDAVSHRTIIEASDEATRADVRKDLYFAYKFGVGLDGTKAAEAARNFIKPEYYVAASELGYIHGNIIARTKTMKNLFAFESHTKHDYEATSSVTIDELRTKILRKY